MLNENEHLDIANSSEFIVIQETAMQIEHAHDPSFAIYNILSICSRLMGLNRGRVLLKEDDSDYLYAAYGYGLMPEEMQRSRFAPKEGITGKVMHTGQPAVVPDIDMDTDYLFRTVDRRTLPQEPVSFLAVPIVRKSKRIGVLTFNRLKNRQRSFDRDLKFLKIIATFISEILTVHKMIELQTRSLKQENEQLRYAAMGQGTQYGIMGESGVLTQALDKAARAATTPVTVMLKGESGTGKEKFSRMIHRASNRKDGPFIAINCAAIPKDLLEAELFGYEKGSFTGANQQKKGKFELAHKGTLFLDEIADLELALQSKLLRVLEEKSITRIGGVQDIPLDVRIVVASHKDLHQAVNEGRFRLDLFYRLNVFPIELPPLRDRYGDIRILANFFLDQANQDYGTTTILAKDAMAFFEHYDWPGNIRQLENVIKRCVLMADQDNTITSDIVKRILEDERGITHQGAQERFEPKYETPISRPAETLVDKRLDVGGQEDTRHYWKVTRDELADIREALRFCRGNKTRAAKMLNMTARQLSYRMDKLGLTVP
jgi:Nif-specific regulatory protein